MLNGKLGYKRCQHVLDILILFLSFRILIVLVVFITLYERLVYMEHAKLEDVVSIPDFWFAMTRLILLSNILIVDVPIALFGKGVSHALVHLEPLLQDPLLLLVVDSFGVFMFYWAFLLNYDVLLNQVIVVHFW